MSEIKIILADDHYVLLAGLKLLLNNEPDFEVTGEATDGEKVLELLEKQTADILILDLSMPNMGGVECIREIKSRGYSIKILVLTMYEDEHYVKEAMRAGAFGYLEKQAVDTELFDAIRMIAKGQRYLSSPNAKNLLNHLLNESNQEINEDPYRLLSAREREVLKLIARGYSMRQIGEKLHLSVKTVDTYKTRLMEKLNFTKKSEVVEYACRYGFLPVKNT